MAVVVQSSIGWVLDHRKLMVLHLKHPDLQTGEDTSEKLTGLTCLTSKSPNSGQEINLVANTINNAVLENDNAVDFSVGVCKKFNMKQEFFNIIAPFKMDSQCSSLSETNASGSVDAFMDTKRKRKRKRKEPLNTGEELAAKFHNEAHVKILHGYTHLMKAARDKDYLQLPSTEYTDNNTEARMAAKLNGPGEIFGDVCWKLRHDEIATDLHIFPANGYNIDNMEEACNKIYRSHQETATIVTVESQKYLVPAHSTFLMSDVSVFSRSCKDLGKFDLIVMDPPWLNKSVKRKKTYFSLQNDVLLDLPLDILMKPNCTVAVWVTNRCKHINFVRNQLFRKYKITYMATWFWLKITKTWDMVCDINSDHKKPYETLIIGKFLKGKPSYDAESSCFYLENKLMVSVPCSLHSKKPPLTEILKDDLPENPACLELFARNLLPHWTSWGNEVLLHQHEDFYEEVT